MLRFALRVAAAVAFLALPALNAYSLTPGEAAAAGRGLAGSSNTTTQGGITTGGVMANMPAQPAPRDCMPATSDLSGVFQGGNGNLSTAAAPVLAGAASSTTPECAAINYMQGRAAEVNPVEVTPTDPVLAGQNEVRSNPSASLGSTANLLVPRATSSCTTGSVVHPGNQIQQVCYDYVELGDQECSKEQRVELSEWWQYTCTIPQYTTTYQTCTTSFDGLTPVNNCGALGACTYAGERCTDGPGETRTINGVEETKDCWGTERTYACRVASSVNHCSQLSAAGCSQVGVQGCAEYAPDGSCMSRQATYRCGSDLGTPPNTEFGGKGFDIAREYMDEGTCSAFKDNPNCSLVKSDCVDDADRVILGYTVKRACWRYADIYSCANTGKSNCAEVAGTPGCTIIPSATACDFLLPDGTCGTTKHIYSCGDPPTVEATTGSTCDTTPYCINGICYDTARPGDPDFAQAVVGMETARQAGHYMNQDTTEIFQGSVSQCKRKLFGLNNCCKGVGGGGQPGSSFTNKAIMEGFAFGKAYLGSAYMWDTLFMSDMSDFMFNGLESLGVISASGANVYSLYGLQIGWSASGGLTIVGFDPWSFVIAIVIQFVISELMSCPESDMLTGQKKKEQLCEYVGTYCSSRTLGVCKTRTESYCCFNSHLAKAINVQGKAQLGLSMGSAKRPMCGGLTVAQVGSLDFSRIDLTEFVSKITTGSGIDSGAAAAAVGERLAGGTFTPLAPVPGEQVTATRPDLTSTVTVPPEAADEPTVAVSWSPDPVISGQDAYINTTTTDATGLSYTCTGPWESSGNLTPGTASTRIRMPANIYGEAVCSFTAANAWHDVTVQANVKVMPPPPTITVTFSPASVSATQSYSMTVQTTDADQVSFVCPTLSWSGNIPAGSYTTPARQAQVSQIGPAVCHVTAKDSASGATRSVTATLDVTTLKPSISASGGSGAVGSAISVSASASDALSVTYTCTGGMSQSGALGGSGGAFTLTPAIANVGTTVCTFTATSLTGDVAQATAYVAVTLE